MTGSASCGQQYLFVRIGRRVQKPFDRILEGWHATAARVLNRVFSDVADVEYARYRNQYIITAPYHRPDEDGYNVGHTAGKLSVVLGLMPFLAAYFAVEGVKMAIRAAPEFWPVSLAFAAVTLALAIFMAVTLLRIVTIGVTYHPSDEPRGEVDTS